MGFLQRKVYFELKNHLKKPEISLILGPRQAGKTTLMLKLKDELEQKGVNTCYFNLDIIEDRYYFTSQNTLLDRIKKMFGKKGVVFIDEIQRLENAGLFLKGLFDLRSLYKFIVSGSGSLELKANIIEPMTGRKKIFHCLPLSFTEFAANKLNCNINVVETNLYQNPHELNRLIHEYFNFGGYPRVVLSETIQEKIDVISEIYKSYLEKDIQLLLGVEKEAAFEALVKILSSQVGNMVNRAELASTLGINEKTVEKYLNFLEKTFIISLVKPFFTNVRKELRKSPKVYFDDLGILRLAQGRLMSPVIEGGFFENACFLRIKELALFEEIKFWRSTSGAEVDFVIISQKTGIPIAIEVKYSQSKKLTLGKSLINFILHYKPEKVFLYTKEHQSSFMRFKTKITQLPYRLLPKI